MTALRRALAVPPFAADPADLIGLGVAAERAGFEGFFLWDHLVFSDTGEGPPILDPWQILAVVASRTSRMRLGTMITPVPRRRPWQLAKETVTLDRLSGGRVILGVGLGSPPYADFGLFHEPADDRERAARLDEGLEVLAGLWTGERFSYQGTHFTLDPVRFSPVPVQQPRIPVWVGGVLPAAGPVRRACRWDGMVPLRRSVDPDGGVTLVGPTPADIAAVRDQAWSARGTPEGFDLVVWADLEQEAGDVERVAPAYVAAGATWWIESADAGPGWQAEAASRVSRGL
ncbi:MAG TPA: LLM class flavin-dependent oxidoreductase [Streptosporangiaceae bacterium]|jgi:alkanesulfonate monooxygenase SsuD/methylene tetrahydromethanopterin reductase-like flavin-dependent oxidoreductase (luciferase family)|nr:LLM class flavin-dependent oxidoreductase [Streptosporangiaceae bacterium]